MLQPPRTEDAEENSKYSRDHHLLYGRYFRPEIKNDKIKWNDNYIWQQIMCDCHSTNIRQWLQQFSCCIAAKQMQNNGYIHYINPPLPGKKILAAWCINLNELVFSSPGSIPRLSHSRNKTNNTSIIAKPRSVSRLFSRCVSVTS